VQEPSDRIHRAVNIGRHSYEEVTRDRTIGEGVKEARRGDGELKTSRLEVGNLPYTTLYKACSETPKHPQSHPDSTSVHNNIHKAGRVTNRLLCPLSDVGTSRSWHSPTMADVHCLERDFRSLDEVSRAVRRCS